MNKLTPEEKLEKLLVMHHRQLDSVICAHCQRVYPCPTVVVIKGGMS